MFKNIFSFNGRIRRTEFGISFIIYFTLYLLILMLTRGNGGIKVLGLGIIPLVWFLLAQGAKRCHDLGKGGGWQLIPFYVLWLLFEDGNPYENEYGKNPKTKVLYNAEDYQDPSEAIIYDNVAVNVAADVIDDVVMMDLAANEQIAVDDSGSYDGDDSLSSDDGTDTF